MLWVLPFVVLGFHPLISHMGQILSFSAASCLFWKGQCTPGKSNPRCWASSLDFYFLLDVDLLLPQHLVSSLMFLDDLYILPWLLSCLQQEGCSESPMCHYQKRRSLFQFQYGPEKDTEELCFLYQSDSLFSKVNPSIFNIMIALFSLNALLFYNVVSFLFLIFTHVI